MAESGCGKSTALALFAKSLDAASYHVLATSLTTVGPFGLISHLAALSRLRSSRFKGDTAARLIAHLRGLPKRTVLLVDEAHLLPDDSLEDLRLLTACDFDRRSPFALTLVGQPLLREIWLRLRSSRFKGDTAARLIAHLRGLPKRTVLLVDEAHLLPDDSLEDLRLLTACDFDRRSPFALTLVVNRA